jgi:hypothetical protein
MRAIAFLFSCLVAGARDVAGAGDSVAAASNTTAALSRNSSADPACCFCKNGGDGSGACFEVSLCNQKPSYSCGPGDGGCAWVPNKRECL